MISSKDCFSVNCKAIWIQLKKEPFYFWFFCGYLFFEYVRPQSIYPIINFIPWAKLCVILAAFGVIGSNQLRFSSTHLGKYFWGLIFAVFVSSIFAEFPSISFSEFNVVLNWLIIYYLCISIVTTRFRFFIVILLIMLASYKMSQHAAISWASRGFTFERWGISGGLGFFGNAADLGVQMLIILPLSIFLIKECYSYWSVPKKLFFIFFPISILMTIIATGERSTLFGLAAIGLVSAISARHRIRNMILMTVFAVGLIAVMPQALLDRFDTIGTDRTSETRMTYWKRGIEFFKENPVLGIGYNNWVPYYQKNPSEEALLEKTGEVAHSTPITVLAELGLLGFAFYYAIVFKTLSLNIRSIKMSRNNIEGIWKDISFSLNIGLVGFLTTSFFLSITFYPFLFIQASLSDSLYNILRYEQKQLD